MGHPKFKPIEGEYHETTDSKYGKEKHYRAVVADTDIPAGNFFARVKGFHVTDIPMPPEGYDLSVISEVAIGLAEHPVKKGDVFWGLTQGMAEVLEKAPVWRKPRHTKRKRKGSKKAN